MSLNFTYRAQIVPNTYLIADADVSAAGTILCVAVNTLTLTIYIARSTDGGVTWSSFATSVPWGGDTPIQWVTGTTWVMTAYPGYGVWSSPDDGSTWNRISAGTIGVQSNSRAKDDGTTVIFPGETSYVDEWSLDGTTWHSGATPNPNWYRPSAAGCMLWDGSQFAAVVTPSDNSAHYVYTAPTGFTAGSGPTWTLQQTATTGGTHTVGGSPSRNFAYMGGAYATIRGGNGIQFSSSISTVLNIDNIQNPYPSSNYSGIWGLEQYWLTGAQSGADVATVAQSANGTSWTKTNHNFLGGVEHLALVVHDAYRGNVVIFGNTGSVSTSPDGFPPHISLSPAVIAVPLGGTTSFTATTTNPPNAAVTWSCVYGTVSNGVYVAPSVPIFVPGDPPPVLVSDTVTASMTDYPGTFATALVVLTNVTNPPPPIGPFGNRGLRGAFSPANVFAPVMIANAGTINPKIYMPQEATTVKA